MISHGSRYARIHLTELLNTTSRVAITRHHHVVKVLVSPQDAKLLESLEASEQPQRQELPQPNTTPTQSVAPTTQRDLLVLRALHWHSHLHWHSQPRLPSDQSPIDSALHDACIAYLDAVNSTKPTK